MHDVTEAQFRDLVVQAEQVAETDPTAYKLRLALFAGLGYAVIFLVLFLLVVLLGGTVALAFFSSSLALLLIKKKFIFLILGGAWMCLKALWVKLERPEGFELKRADFPELYAELDQLTHALDALKIHKVLLDEQMNAAVVQHPKMGVLGVQENYLMLGLELMMAMSPAQMRSVLAHELGHLSGNHSHFAGWIYRVRISWQRLATAFHQTDALGGKLMARFLDWYAPRFAAYSFVLARQNEYEADAISAQLTSAEVAAQALVNLHATAPYIEENFWKQFFKLAETCPSPPYSPYEGLSRFLKDSPLAREEVITRVKQSLKEETRYDDTHPALKDRLRALNGRHIVPESLTVSAAEAWLGARYQEVIRHFDTNWLARQGDNWEKHHEYVTRARAGLLAFRQRSLTELSDDELWDYACWSHEFENNETALPLFRAFQERHPDSVGAAYHVGCILMQQENAEALLHLRKAFVQPHLLREVAERGYYLLEQVLHRKEDAEKWWADAMQEHERQKIIQEECDVIRHSDTFCAPDMPPALRDELKAYLSTQKNVGKCWIARKVMQHSDTPVYLVVFRPRGLYWTYSQIMKRLAAGCRIDAHLFFVCAWGDERALAKKVQKAGEVL